MGEFEGLVLGRPLEQGQEVGKTLWCGRVDPTSSVTAPRRPDRYEVWE